MNTERQIDPDAVLELVRRTAGAMALELIRRFLEFDDSGDVENHYNTSSERSGEFWTVVSEMRALVEAVPK